MDIPINSKPIFEKGQIVETFTSKNDPDQGFSLGIVWTSSFNKEDNRHKYFIKIFADIKDNKIVPYVQTLNVLRFEEHIFHQKFPT